MKIAILGSEYYPLPFEIESVIIKVFSTNENLLFLSRGIYGVDKYAERVLDEEVVQEGYSVLKQICNDDEFIIQQSDVVVIFWDGYCLRTKKLFDLALKYHKPITMHIRKS